MGESGATALATLTCISAGLKERRICRNTELRAGKTPVLRTELLLNFRRGQLWVNLDIGVGSAHGLETVKWLNGVLEVCTY